MGMLSKLAVRLPDIPRVYDAERFRAWIVDIEGALSRVRVSTAVPAKAAKTADYTITAEDELVLVDTTAGNITVTLPLISDAMVSAQYDVTIKKVSTFNSVTISGTDTIDGYTGVAITTLNTALHLRATAVGWKIT